MNILPTPKNLSAILGLLLAITVQAEVKPAEPPLSETLGPSLIENGDFNQTSTIEEIVPGWTVGDAGQVTVMSEEDQNFVRLVSEAPNQLVQIVQKVSLPEGLKGVAFHARFRNENVQFGDGGWLCDARARFRFVDDEGNTVGNKLKDIIFQSQARNWTQKSDEYLVPEGARAMMVNLCLNKAKSGTLDLEEVKLVEMTEQRFQEIEVANQLEIQKKEAEAQKKIADQKIIETMVQAEPISRQLGVYGNRLINSDHESIILQGVNVVSLEWSANGENILRSMKVALKEWKANAIRLPVHDSFWFGNGKGKVTSNDQEAYRKVVDDAIAMAAGEGAYVILDLHRYGAPQEFARTFWTDAATRYANHPAVLFDLYNEPHGIGWELWHDGGEFEVKKDGKMVTVQVVGMQALVDAVRATGARNIIVAGGLSHALNISGVIDGYELDNKGGYGIMYATHFYNWHSGWEKYFLNVAEKHPVLVGEFGADKKKMSFVPANKQEDPYTWMPDALAMIQKYELNWTAFSMHPKATPVLIKDWSYEPTDFFGAFVKDALAGKKFELKKMR